jgi:hypothetical protein
MRMAASARLAALPRPLPASELAHLAISEPDFWAGLANVQPSARREGFSTVPDVSWADVGALTELRAELNICLLQPLRFPKRFAALGLSASAGVLLYGPPGCGKTLLAKAVANESGACFIAVKVRAPRAVCARGDLRRCVRVDACARVCARVRACVPLCRRVCLWCGLSLSLSLSLFLSLTLSRAHALLLPRCRSLWSLSLSPARAHHITTVRSRAHSHPRTRAHPRRSPSLPAPVARALSC